MKRFLALLLALISLCGLTACQGEVPATTEENTAPSSATTEEEKITTEENPLVIPTVPSPLTWDQINAIPVAEFCVAQILLSLKGYFRGLNEFTSPEGRNAARKCIGRGVYGETVALIGAGAISTKVQGFPGNSVVKNLPAMQKTQM